ncbi:hypothetical protein M3P05_17645 [Sansalvadorimonas sp. 2012CJ34-2]|uniref:PepSY domain-containing protein n=1 Tax=Parendozoicomonas callyspongiae TaxID=2942213 RepID=A0ABT0PKE7_9GAMM|nr:hypothetical protein [Sansalvadorimonas sp. 2012CJ34-2]MCL6271746.1 hypothetical protein [Sansalvadorimonas sp. 2012CJ34-2]
MKSTGKAVGAIALGMIVTSTAMAWQGGGPNGGKGFRNPEGCAMMSAEQRERELTAAELKDLIKSRMWNDNLTVGEVTPTDKGYTVKIVTVQSGDLVREMDFAKNGLPARVMQRFEDGVMFGPRGGKGHHGGHRWQNQPQPETQS